MAQPESGGSADHARLLAAGVASDDQPSGTSASPVLREGWHGRFELKRQNTSRGTPEESTQTTLRIERFFEGSVAALRLDLPFPDEDTDFEGSPFSPRLGDIKIRARFRPLSASGYTFPSFVEVTFPTADPDTLGSGKYQLSAGIRMVVPLTLPVAHPKDHKAQFEAEVQQVNSFAGDPSRNDINYTKLEFTFYDVWRQQYTVKLKFKPSVDWTQNGSTGSVGEVEGGLFFARDWRAWLMLGHRLSGPEGIKGTYNTRVEMGLARTF